MAEHKIKNAKIESIEGSMGRIVYELEGGGVATAAVSIELPKSEPTAEPTGGGDAESKAKLAKQKKIAEAELEDSSETESGEETVELTGKLPEDFPGKSALDAADPPIHTYKQLSKFAPDYTDIPGIGAATAKKIEEALAGE
jgi:hypothetical protein